MAHYILQDLCLSLKYPNNVCMLQVANYIPQLAKRDPNKFGISICTIDGQRFSIGDATLPFTLQSCWWERIFVIYSWYFTNPNIDLWFEIRTIFVVQSIINHFPDVQTSQSWRLVLSKPLNYAIALNELGSEVVHGYVGTEPTGGKFNALELDYRSE